MGENINVSKRGHKEGKKEGTGRTLTEGRKRAKGKKEKREKRKIEKSGNGGKEEKTKRRKD